MTIILRKEQLNILRERFPDYLTDSIVCKLYLLEGTGVNWVEDFQTILGRLPFGKFRFDQILSKVEYDRIVNIYGKTLSKVFELYIKSHDIGVEILKKDSSNRNVYYRK